MTTAEAIYLLSAGASLASALPYVDLVLVPSIDLSILRTAAAASAGLLSLLYGLLWEARG